MPVMKLNFNIEFSCVPNSHLLPFPNGIDLLPTGTVRCELNVYSALNQDLNITYIPLFISIID